MINLIVNMEYGLPLITKILIRMSLDYNRTDAPRTINTTRREIKHGTSRSLQSNVLHSLDSSYNTADLSGAILTDPEWPEININKTVFKPSIALNCLPNVWYRSYSLCTSQLNPRPLDPRGIAGNVTFPQCYISASPPPSRDSWLLQSPPPPSTGTVGCYNPCPNDPVLT